MEKRLFTGTKLFAVAAWMTFASACASMGDGAGLAVGSVSELQDDQILHTFLTINEGEVITSQPVAGSGGVAMSDGASTSGHAGTSHSIILTGDPSVDARAFARMMVDHHGIVIQEIQSMAGNMDLDLQPTQVSMTLSNTAQGIAQQLESLSGIQEELEYIQNQIVLHQNALNMLDHTLIPQANDAQLRLMLQDGRQDVANHLTMAQQIHASMKAQMGL